MSESLTSFLSTRPQGDSGVLIVEDAPEPFPSYTVLPKIDMGQRPTNSSEISWIVMCFYHYVGKHGRNAELKDAHLRALRSAIMANNPPLLDRGIFEHLSDEEERLQHGIDCPIYWDRFFKELRILEKLDGICLIPVYGCQDPQRLAQLCSPNCWWVSVQKPLPSRVFNL